MGLDVLFPTNFRFDHHVVLCWLLECTEFWVRAQRSYCFNVICLIWWQLISFVSNRESSLLCCSLFWSFCSESTSLSVRCYTLACEENMAATVGFFFERNMHCDARTGWSCWVIGSLEPSIRNASPLYPLGSCQLLFLHHFPPFENPFRPPETVVCAC